MNVLNWKSFLILMIVGLLISFQCWSQQDEETLGKEEDKYEEKVIKEAHNIKSVTQWNYRKSYAKRKIHSLLLYDDQGNPIEYAEYDLFGKKKEKYIFMHDEQKNNFRTIKYNSYNQISYTWDYNKKNNIIEEIRYGNRRIVFKWTYEYNDQDELIKAEKFSSRNRIKVKYTYKYDNRNNQIEQLKYHPNGKIISRWALSYDDKDNLVKLELPSSHKYNSIVDYIYNENDKIIFEKCYVEDGYYNSDGTLIYGKSYEYDDADSLIQIISTFYYQGGHINQTSINQIIYYSGNMIGQTMVIENFYESDDGGMENSIEDTKWTYKYNDKGHLIEVTKEQSMRRPNEFLTSFFNPKSVSLKKYIYVYYE